MKSECISGITCLRFYQLSSFFQFSKVVAVVLTVLGALGLIPMYTSDYHQWQHLFVRLLKTLGRHLHFFAHFCAGQFLCNIQSSVGSCFLSTLGAVDG